MPYTGIRDLSSLVRVLNAKHLVPIQFMGLVALGEFDPNLQAKGPRPFHPFLSFSGDITMRPLKYFTETSQYLISVNHTLCLAVHTRGAWGKGIEKPEAKRNLELATPNEHA